jgi:phosphomannomutase
VYRAVHDRLEKNRLRERTAMKVQTLQEIAVNAEVEFSVHGALGPVTGLTPAVCHAFTTAFLNVAAARTATILLGHDARTSSPVLAAACAAAIEDQGRQVVHGSALPTPALVLYAAQTGAAVVVVTGGDAPSDQNGLRFFRDDGMLLPADIAAMQNHLLGLPAGLKPPPLPTPEPGVRSAYIKRYVDFWGAEALSATTVALYGHHGVGLDTLHTVLQALGATVLPMALPDAAPHKPLDRRLRSDTTLTRGWAAVNDFDAILCAVGDGSHPWVGDEHGEWVAGDLVGIASAHHLGAQAVATPVTSNTALERCQLFSKVSRTRLEAGAVAANLAQLRRDGADPVVGWDADGGFWLGSQVLRSGKRLGPLVTADGLLPAVALLCAAQARHLTVSGLVATLPKRFTASDLVQKLPHQASDSLLERLAQDEHLIAPLLAPDSGAVKALDETDGLRAFFANGDIVHLRAAPSQTGMHCYTEAANAAHARKLCDACLLRVMQLVG